MVTRVSVSPALSVGSSDARQASDEPAIPDEPPKDDDLTVGLNACLCTLWLRGSENSAWLSFGCLATCTDIERERETDRHTDTQTYHASTTFLPGRIELQLFSPT